MTRHWWLAVLLVALSGPWAASASAADFGITNLDVIYENEDGSPALLAGSHPFAITFDLDANTEELEGGEIVSAGAIKTINIEQPAGFAGDPTALPSCSSALFLVATSSEAITCPNETVVGKTDVRISSAGEASTETVPVYSLDAPPGAILKFGFIVKGVPVTFEADLSPIYPYNPLVKISNISQAAEFLTSSTTVWGFPASSAHDLERGTCLRTLGECPVPTLDEKAFLTLPRSCTGPLATVFEADSWQDPETWVKPPPVLSHNDSEPPVPEGLSGCEELEFEPEVDVAPTTTQAESASGLDFDYNLEDEGIFEPEGRAQSDMKKAVVRLPEGISANPSLAGGLSACTPAQFAAESLGSEPGEGCPEASKIGTVEAQTPLLEETVLKGQLFVAAPYENPFGTLLALYLVIREPKRGIFVALPGKVEADAQTGQLTTTFGEVPFELPQFPISQLHVQLRSGPRAPLVTPQGCGSYPIEVEMTPWSEPESPLTVESSFQVTQGPGGSPCPSALPFAPGFRAGTINNDAGSHSPLYIHLTRGDGQQDLSRFAVTLPPGVTATLAGVAQCPEAAIATARTKTGNQEQAAPSCPADSRIGGVLAGAGVGSALTYTEGSIYLAGPFEGAPLSAVSIVPAVAGPFDLGNVVVRQALRIDPRTAQATVDGSHSEPFPHILAGIPVHLRDVRAAIDRPNFTLNPTSCNPFAVQASIWGGGKDPLSGTDDEIAALADRFQAANCAGLGFNPKLTLRLEGGTHRSDFPALHAVLAPRAGDSNIAAAAVTLPHSAFLEQAHIGTICTRVQFAAHACPARSVYGHATVYTPILPGPAEGPVYLRSSNHALPDLVMALKGPASVPVEAEVIGRIDSKNGGIRTTFEETPDLPVERLVLDMRGGKKGLIVNSRELCPHPSKATVRFTAQNGRVAKLRPVVKVRCKKERAGKRKK
jgi:hypothetical protein